MVITGVIDTRSESFTESLQFIQNEQPEVHQTLKHILSISDLPFVIFVLYIKNAADTCICK
jgi:hypothetical protein